MHGGQEGGLDAAEKVREAVQALDIGQLDGPITASLGVAVGDVEVVAVQEVTWTDGSRGCAKKGMNYTMSMIDGSRITLRVDGTTYEYHSGGSGRPFLCERPTQ